MENKGIYSFMINGQEWHFKFGMNAYKMLFEESDFFGLLTSNKIVTVACLAFFAGAKSMRKLNNLSVDWSIEDATDYLEESDNQEVINEIFLACMDCLGFMYRTAGASPDHVRIMKELGEKAREAMTKQLSALQNAENLPTE